MQRDEQGYASTVTRKTQNGKRRLGEIAWKRDFVRRVGNGLP
jgi:hypothetical protein